MYVLSDKIYHSLCYNYIIQIITISHTQICKLHHIYFKFIKQLVILIYEMCGSIVKFQIYRTMNNIRTSIKYSSCIRYKKATFDYSTSHPLSSCHVIFFIGSLVKIICEWKHHITLIFVCWFVKKENKTIAVGMVTILSPLIMLTEFQYSLCRIYWVKHFKNLIRRYTKTTCFQRTKWISKTKNRCRQICALNELSICVTSLRHEWVSVLNAKHFNNKHS